MRNKSEASCSQHSMTHAAMATAWCTVRDLINLPAHCVSHFSSTLSGHGGLAVRGGRGHHQERVHCQAGGAEEDRWVWQKCRKCGSCSRACPVLLPSSSLPRYPRLAGSLFNVPFNTSFLKEAVVGVHRDASVEEQARGSCHSVTTSHQPFPLPLLQVFPLRRARLRTRRAALLPRRCVRRPSTTSLSPATTARSMRTSPRPSARPLPRRRRVR